MAEFPLYPIGPDSTSYLSSTAPAGEQVPTTTMPSYLSVNTADTVQISTNLDVNATSTQYKDPLNQYPGLLQSEPINGNSLLQVGASGATGLQTESDLKKELLYAPFSSLIGATGPTISQPVAEIATQYDDQGRPLRRTIYDPNNIQPNGLGAVVEITTFDYTGQNPTSVTVNGKGFKTRLTQYNQDGQPTRIQFLGLDGETVTSTQELTYNANDILTQTVSRDANGRMTSRSTADEFGQIRQTEVFNPDTGQLQTRIYYDEEGNVLDTIQY